MKITVRYFAGLREQKGQDSEELSVPSGSTAEDVVQSLVPEGPNGRLPVMVAVNCAYVSREHLLQEGDEVALIPPLGGG